MSIGYNLCVETTRHFWEYRTVPHSNLDLVARVAIEPACRLLIGASKPSHSWNWKRYPYPEGFEGNLVNGDPKAFSRHNFIDFLRMESRWGWQRVRKIHPDLDKLPSDRQLSYWQYCWSPEDRRFLERCAVAIDPEEAIRVFIGPKPFGIHGYGSDNLEVPLIISDEFSRWDRCYTHLPIF